MKLFIYIHLQYTIMDNGQTIKFLSHNTKPPENENEQKIVIIYICLCVYLCVNTEIDFEA